LSLKKLFRVADATHHSIQLTNIANTVPAKFNSIFLKNFQSSANAIWLLSALIAKSLYKSNDWGVIFNGKKY
jgi:hypothetical protein